MLYRIVILFLIFRCATALFAQDSTAILDSTIRLMEIEIADKIWQELCDFVEKN